MCRLRDSPASPQLYFGATVTGRYIKNVKESAGPPGTTGPHSLGSKFYTDAQLRWNPTLNLLDNIGIAVGVNNLFNTKAPACFTCDVNGFDPTTYDIPGRYYYARLGVKMGGDRSVPPAYAPPPAPLPPPLEAEPAPPPPPPPPPAERGERGS